MFERYTEKARRLIFFARHEASNFGSPYIETEHLLMGILREDKALTNRFLRSHASVESIRKQIEEHTMVREKIATSVDLPLSNESKRVLAYAAEEAARLGHKHIGSEHLLLGLLREEKCFAAEILKERGVKLKTVREELAKVAEESSQRVSANLVPLEECFGDLTQAATDGNLEPIVGRGPEVEAVIEVLAASENRNAILVGERGVGKRTIVEALAQRIAEVSVPPFLAEKRILLFEPQSLAVSAKDRIQFVNQLKENLIALVETGNSILFLSDLHASFSRGPVFASSMAAETLNAGLIEGKIQCIAACTLKEYKELGQAIRWIDDWFRAVYVRPLSEEDSISALTVRKLRYEMFHAVSFDDEALASAVMFADRYLPDRALPGKALELLDAAAARVKLRQSLLPEEIIEVQKRIRFIVHRMDSAIANHEFEKARFYSDEEKKERESLEALRKKHRLDEDTSNVVRPEDVEEISLRWSEYPFQP